jgi:hypothetical protein
MKRFQARFCLLGLLPLACLAGPAAPTDRELHLASCVAALEANTDALVKQVKAGREDLRPLLQERLQDGVAFIGTAYLHGERDKARAQALLTDAREAQKALPAEELSARQDACAAEGSKLLSGANVIERLVVWRLTGNRMKKLLAE